MAGPHAETIANRAWTIVEPGLPVVVRGGMLPDPYFAFHLLRCPAGHFALLRTAIAQDPSRLSCWLPCDTCKQSFRSPV